MAALHFPDNVSPPSISSTSSGTAAAASGLRRTASSALSVGKAPGVAAGLAAGAGSKGFFSGCAGCAGAAGANTFSSVSLTATVELALPCVGAPPPPTPPAELDVDGAAVAVGVAAATAAKTSTSPPAVPGAVDDGGTYCSATSLCEPKLRSCPVRTTLKQGESSQRAKDGAQLSRCQ